MKMARQLVAALAFAHGAKALVDGFVDVLVNVDVRVPAELFAGVVGAAAGDEDSGYEACNTIGSVISSCQAAGMLGPTAPAVSAGSCLCCINKSAISSAYASCASYAAQIQGGGPTVTSAYRVATQVFSVCSALGSGVCTGGRGLDGTATLPVTTPTRAATPPAACGSMLTIYNSCSQKLNFRTARPRDVASCFCHDSSGDYNTVFQDYASSCADTVGTAANDYSVIERLATFCNDFPPITNTSPLLFTRVSTRTDGQFALPSSTSSTPSPTPSASSPASSPTDGAARSTGTTSTSTGLAAAGAAPGFLVCAANLATFILSLFVLI